MGGGRAVRGGGACRKRVVKDEHCLKRIEEKGVATCVEEKKG